MEWLKVLGITGLVRGNLCVLFITYSSMMNNEHHLSSSLGCVLFGWHPLLPRGLSVQLGSGTLH